MAKKLDEIGFFRQGEVIFDANSKKFVPNPTKKRLETFFSPKSLESMNERAQIAMSNIRTQKEKILKGKIIPGSEVMAAIDAGINDLVSGFNVDQRATVGQGLKQIILDDLYSMNIARNVGGVPHLSSGNMIVDATGLDRYKGYLGDEVSKSFEKRLRDVGVSDEGIIAARARIDKLLDKVGGVDYKELNDISSKLNLVSQDAIMKVAREDATGVEKAALTRGGLRDRVVDFLNPAPVGVGRARIGKGIENNNLPLNILRQGAKRLPVEFYNNKQQEVPYAPGMGPQSMNVPNIPEQFIRTPLPRSTDGLMKKKNFVLGKVAQMMPEMFESVKDTYEHEPERLSEIAQVLAVKMPHLFERDKYNRFDGRILSEADKQVAIKDTLLRKDLSPIDQAKIITRLNKEGLYEV